MCKRICLPLSMLFVILFAGTVWADVNIAAAFPDPALRKIVEQYDEYNYHKGRDGVLSDYEIERITQIDYRINCDYHDKQWLENNKDNIIRDLTGINTLTSLKELRLGNQLISEIDLSGMPALEKFDYDNSDVMHNIYAESSDVPYVKISADNCPSLQYVNVNAPSEVIIKDCKALDTVSVYGIKIYDVIFSGDERIETERYHLSRANIEGCTSIKNLRLGYVVTPESLNLKDYKNLMSLYLCYCPEIKSLNAGGCEELQEVNIRDNEQLSTLNLSGCVSLEQTYISSNRLNTVNLKDCSALQYLDCCFNFKITALDLSSCTSLEHLDCRYNALTKLGLSKNTALKKFYCSYNSMAYLNLDKNTALTDYSIDSQTVYGLKATLAGEYWEINFKDYMPLANISRINPKSISLSTWKKSYAPESFNPSTGIARFKVYPSFTPPEYLRYKYYTRSDKSPAMSVIVRHDNIYPRTISNNHYGSIIDNIDNNGYYLYEYYNNNRLKAAIDEKTLNRLGYNYTYNCAGLTVDGNSRLILSITPDEPGTAIFTVPASLGLTLENLTRSKQSTFSISIPTTEVSNGKYRASVVLTAPESWPSSLKNFPMDKFKLYVSFKDIKGNITMSERDLVLHAAPVLLIHGLRGTIDGTFNIKDGKGKSGIWYKLRQAGYLSQYEQKKYGWRDIFGWDYDGTRGPNDLLADDYNGLYSAISGALDHYRAMGIECTRVDIVAHSMGGLMARKFLQEPDRDSDYGNNRSILAYKQGMVRRVITVATPHRGSPWADLLLSKNDGNKAAQTARNALNAVLNKAAGMKLRTNADSAYSDLVVGAQNYGFPQNVPMHSIYGNVHNKTLLKSLVLSSIVNTFEEVLAKYAGHDLIVPVSSAKGDFKSKYVTGFPQTALTKSALLNYNHMTICNQNDVGQRVVDLLKGPVTNFQIGDFTGSNDDFTAPPSITKAALPYGVKGVQYEAQLQIDNTSTISWNKHPAGLVIDDSGRITGTPTKTGKTDFKVTVQNSTGKKASANFSITVYEKPTIKAKTLKAGTTGKSYSASLSASGTKKITWSALGLPDGMKINASNGKISGTPRQSGRFSVTVFAMNAYGTDEKTFTLDIKPKITTSKLANVIINEEYTATLALYGTNENITWSVVKGTLPEGLTLNESSGVISGRTLRSLSKAKTFKFTVRASAAYNLYHDKAFSLTVKGRAPAVVTSGLDSGTIGSEYNLELNASGTGPFTWKASGLPKGLSVKEGRITGTPAKAGKFSVKLTVSSKWGSKSKTLKLIVNNVQPVINKDSAINSTGSDTKTFAPALKNTKAYAELDAKIQTMERSNNFTAGNNIKFGGCDYVIACVLDAISVTESGQYDIKAEIDESIRTGAKLIWIANPVYSEADTELYSEDDRIADFYDDEGMEIDAVPESHSITVSPWLRAGVVYEPVIAVEVK